MNYWNIQNHIEYVEYRTLKYLNRLIVFTDLLIHWWALISILLNNPPTMAQGK